MSPVMHVLKAIKAALAREDVQKDLRRKGARLLAGTLLIISAFYVYNRYGIEPVKNITLVLVLFAVAFDYLRLNFDLNVPFLSPFVMHGYEQQGFQGTTFAGLGALLALSFSDFDIAMAACAIFIYGDAAANLVGKTFGKTKILGRNKTVVGSIAMFVIGFIAARLILPDGHTAIFMALLATAIEIAVIMPADDFAIPLFTALGGQFFGAMLGVRNYLEGFLFGIALFLIVVGATVIFVFIFNYSRKVLSWQKKSST